jgi:signal transduction histidine kinase
MVGARVVGLAVVPEHAERAFDHVSNVINFPQQATDHRHVGGTFLADPELHTHAVQFYEKDEFLADAVGQFLTAGLRAGDRMVVIASNPHTEAFLARLDQLAVDRALRDGQLTLLDAYETLSKFMIGDMPDPDLFREMLAHLITRMKADGHPHARIRAYGEMADLLWRDGNSKAAIRLEELWNDAGKEQSFSLLCAYVVGNFYKEGDAERFIEVCRNHSHVIPTERFSTLDDPSARLREISLLQHRSRLLETEIQHRKTLEDALRHALRERSRVEEELRAAVKREQEARARAEASDAFKEMFLGILGHDLRNPLNTVLMTARVMQLRGEVPPESQKRLERVIVSGVRMQRMIEQLLDVTRARLAEGIPVERGEERELGPLVRKIVDEVRAGNPGRIIEFDADSCTARVDADRLEQVISNLLGNAVTHGNGGKPIRVQVTARGPLASIGVHNYGTPIDPAVIPRLFDPFKRAGGTKGGADGPGLGLFISERIIVAHGGTIEVQSGEETGTRFEAIFPRV